AAQVLQGRAYRCRVPQGQRAVRDDSARRATTFRTSRRIALLPGRMTYQYAAKARLVFGSVARTRVSVLSKVPARTGSRRNSIPALIHPGSDQARRAAASRCGGTDPPSRRQAWLRPAAITTWGRSENSTGMGVTSRKLRPANGPGFLPESRAGKMRAPSSAWPRGRADMVTRCRASHTAGSGARATREWQIRYRGFGITSSRSMTSSLLHSVPNACTVQPKARPAGDTVTVAD